MTAARRFTARVLLSGQPVPSLQIVRVDVDATRYGRCDTCEVEVAIERSQGSQPGAWMETLLGGGADVILQVRDLSGPTDWATLFHGVVDHLDWRPDDGFAVLECRDYLARLIDMRLQAAWLNLTGVELVRAVVAAASLQSSVMFPEAMTGQFWQIEHKRSASLAQHRFQTAFDLASFVAREAGCDLYAQGTTIMCAPIAGPPSTGVGVRDLSGVVVGRALAHDCQITGGVVVHVASWDSRQRTATHVYYDGTQYSVQPLTTGVVHSFRVPGRRSDDVHAIAQGKYNRITAHAASAHVRIAGQLDLEPRQFVRGVFDTPPWSGVLSIDALRSHLSTDGGFTQHLTLRDRQGDGA